MLSLFGQLFESSTPLFEPPPLFVTNIDQAITIHTFCEFFSQFQGFQNAEFIANPDITTKSAYVRFQDTQQAEAAKEKAQYKLLGKKNIRITFQRAKEYCLLETALFIENLPQGCTNKDLRDHFNHIGISICLAKVDKSLEGQAFGRGYILFETKDDAEMVLHQMEDKKFKNNELKLSYLNSIHKNNVSKTTLHVNNLPRNKTSEELKEFLTSIMSDFGTIKQITLEMGTYSAMIVFNEQDDAQAAFNNFTKDVKLSKVFDISWNKKDQFEFNPSPGKVELSMLLRSNSNEIIENSEESGFKLQHFNHEERKVDFTKQKLETISKEVDNTRPSRLENDVQMVRLFSNFEKIVDIRVEDYNNLTTKKKSRILKKFLFSRIKNIFFETLLPQTMSMITKGSNLDVQDMFNLVRNGSSLKEIIQRIVESIESGDKFDIKTYLQYIKARDIDKINQQEKTKNDLALKQKLGMTFESFCNLDKKAQVKHLRTIFNQLVYASLVSIKIGQITEIIVFLSELPLTDVLMLFEHRGAFKTKVLEIVENLKIKRQNVSQPVKVINLGENKIQMLDDKEEENVCSNMNTCVQPPLNRAEYQMIFCDSELKRRDIKGSAVRVKIEPCPVQDPDILEQLIFDNFAVFGKINLFFIKKSKTGKFGLVLVFEEEKSAENARTYFRSNNKGMKVGWYTQPNSSKRKVSVSSNENRNLIPDINQNVNFIFSKEESAEQLRDDSETKSDKPESERNTNQEIRLVNHTNLGGNLSKKLPLKTRIKIHFNIEYSKFRDCNKAQKNRILEQLISSHLTSLTNNVSEVLSNFKSKRWWNVDYIMELVENRGLLKKRINEAMSEIEIGKSLYK